jgi:hypothetical protein
VPPTVTVDGVAVRFGEAPYAPNADTALTAVKHAPQTVISPRRGFLDSNLLDIDATVR